MDSDTKKCFEIVLKSLQTILEVLESQNEILMKGQNEEPN